MSDGLLERSELDETGASIASLQLANGMIPWFAGGHGDPWNHTEAAMALAVTGHVAEAEAAYRWLASAQLDDGSWCLYHLADGIEDPRRDPNVGLYVATGLWWHYLETRDEALLAEMWPVVAKAVDFAAGLALPGGEIAWSRDPDGRPGRFALLSANASIHRSLHAALSIARHLGQDRPKWGDLARRVGHAVAARRGPFAAKDRWAMDWYYPALSGAVEPSRALRRIEEGWERFVMEGLGVRCVADEPWVTAAETAECVMALDALGETERASQLLGWTRHLRRGDGSYWTGCVHPQCVRYPGGEVSTYAAAAVVMAHHVVAGAGPASGLFHEVHLPVG